VAAVLIGPTTKTTTTRYNLSPGGKEENYKKYISNDTRNTYPGPPEHGGVIMMYTTSISFI
jgi:hypothetical protein